MSVSSRSITVTCVQQALEIAEWLQHRPGLMEVRTCIWVSHVGDWGLGPWVIICCVPRHINKKLCSNSWGLCFVPVVCWSVFLLVSHSRLVAWCCYSVIIYRDSEISRQLLRKLLLAFRLELWWICRLI